MDGRPLWQQPNTALGSYRPGRGVSEQFGGGGPLDRHGSATDRNAERIHLPSARVGVLFVVLQVTFRRREWMVFRQRHVPDRRWATLAIVEESEALGQPSGCSFFVLAPRRLLARNRHFTHCVDAFYRLVRPFRFSSTHRGRGLWDENAAMASLSEVRMSNRSSSPVIRNTSATLGCRVASFTSASRLRADIRTEPSAPTPPLSI